MANKPFNSRIQLKHDTEAHWILAQNFSPLAGELIIYDVDATHSTPRFKVGDGTTNVNDLPFSKKLVTDSEDGLMSLEDKIKLDNANIYNEIGFSSVASFNDAVAANALNTTIDIEPAQDLHGYDHPWPAGGGKNLFDKENWMNPLTSTTVTWNNNIATITTTNGTYGGTGSPLQTFVANTTYACSCHIKVITRDANWPPRLTIRNTNSIIVASASVAENTTETDLQFTYTPTSTTEGYVSFVITGGTAANAQVQVSNVQLEVGSAATSFEPYSNVRPISGWTGAKVTRTGFNVWDEEWEVGGYSTSTGEKGVDPSRIRCKNQIPCKPNTLYYNCSSQTVIFLFYDCNSNYINYLGVVSNHDFTTPHNACYIAFYVASAYGTTYNHDISINYPSTDHDYHAYNGSTHDIAFPTEAGTVYGGTLDVTTGLLTVTMAEVDLGTLAWSYSNVSGHERFYTTSVADRIRRTSSSDETANAISSALKTSTSNRVYGHIFDNSFAVGSDGNIYVYTSSYTDVATFKAAMSGVQLVYELDTPITYQLTTPTQIALLKGVNNVWADTGDIFIKYLTNDSLGINKFLNSQTSGVHWVCATSNSSASDALTYDTAVTPVVGQVIFVTLTKATAGTANMTLKFGGNAAISIVNSLNTAVKAVYPAGAILQLVYANSKFYLLNLTTTL